jgi:putative chitinase
MKRKKPQWRSYKYSDCPNCGASLEVLAMGDFWEREDEKIRCSSGCGFVSSLGFDDDGKGRIFVRRGNIVNIIKKESMIQKIKRPTFYSKIRSTIFNGKISTLQVEGIEVILNEWEARKLTDLRWLAYILATTYHESGYTFQPVAEYGKGKGKKYGIPDPITGKVYYGRGYCQLTWKSNYEKFSSLLNVDLVHNPDLAMDTKISTDILFKGMMQGLFTGRRLGDYFVGKKEDWVNARRIINGVDMAYQIAGYGYKFIDALK